MKGKLPEGLQVAPDLRRIAEERVRRAGTPPAVSHDAARLMHELQVHQIALELQNAELAQARNKAEEALARYMDLYDFAPVGYLSLDARGAVLQANLTVAGLLGCERPGLIGRRLAEFLAEGSIPAYAKLLFRLFEAGETQASEPLLEVCGAVPIFVSMEASLADDRQSCRAVLVDVTERHLATEALRKFSRVIEQSASSVIITDRQGVIEYVNPHFCDASGYRAEEVVGRRPDVLKSGHTPEAEYQDLWRTITSGSTWRGEFLNRRKDGSFYWEAAIVSPVLDESGWITHFVGIQDDVTDRKRAEQDLRESEEKLRLAVDGARIGLWDWDIEAGRLRLSPRSWEILGLAPGESETHESLFTHVDPQDRAVISDRLKAALRDNTDFDVEYRIHMPDGTQRWVAARGRGLCGDGGPAVRMVGIVLDVSERKRGEAAILGMRAEMERHMRRHVASQTVAAMAHELNQPLTAVSAYALTARRLLRAGNQAPDKLEHALDNGIRQAQRAGQVMRDLLRFLQMGEDKIDSVDLSQLVVSAVSYVRAGSGEFQAVLDLEPELQQVCANRIQVEKVLVNLIQNGLEAMRDACVEAELIVVVARTAADGRMAHVTVTDGGPGLDEHTRDRLFDPFFSTKATGLGMGLPISRAIIEELGGEMWVESTPGSGASFHFTLPFAPCPMQPSS